MSSTCESSWRRRAWTWKFGTLLGFLKARAEGYRSWSRKTAGDNLDVPGAVDLGTLSANTSHHQEGDWRESHPVMNQSSRRDLGTISSCTLFFTFSDDKFQTYRKIEECNEHSHTHFLK